MLSAAGTVVDDMKGRSSCDTNEVEDCDCGFLCGGALSPFALELPVVVVVVFDGGGFFMDDPFGGGWLGW